MATGGLPLPRNGDSQNEIEETNTSTKDKRDVILSEKGLLAFEEECSKYKKPIFETWGKVEKCILRVQKCDRNIEQYQILQSDIENTFSEFHNSIKQYLVFLQRHSRSEQGKSEIKRCTEDFEKGKSVVYKALDNIKAAKLDLLETASEISTTSTERKRRKERKLEVMKKEAELRKQKLRLEEDESIRIAEMNRKKCELDIDLDLLKQEQSASDDELSMEQDLADIERESSGERTQKFVENIPSNPVDVQIPTTESPHVLSEMALLMIKKQMLPERFSNFDDSPDSYNAWKETFTNIISELKVSCNEELELMLNRLTGNSKLTAIGIRNANPGKPKEALQIIWKRLDEMYGRPEMIEASIRHQLENFRPVTSAENKRLYDLLNILIKIESLMANSTFSTSLSYFNSSIGVNPIINKLPFHLQEKWIAKASNYKKLNKVPFPPFSYFVTFVREMSEIRNDPAFVFTNSRQPALKRPVYSKKSEVSTDNNNNARCPYHKADHSIHDCRAFRAKPFFERKNFLQSKNICTRCCTSTSHTAKDCQVKIQCTACGSVYHTTALHINKGPSSSPSMHGGEKMYNSALQTMKSETDNISPVPMKASTNTSVKCTTFCGDHYQGRSCSKIFLVDVFHTDCPNNMYRVYAIVDDQCNQSLASPELFDALNIMSSPIHYTLTTCMGKTAQNGRQAHSMKIRSLDTAVTMDLPLLMECDDIPNETSEIPTPEVAKSYPHLLRIASSIPEFDVNSKIQLLIGRDLIEAHHIEEQITGPRGEPFAQRLSLGWAIIGEVCLGRLHRRTSVNVNKVSILNDGRVTCSQPCQNNIDVKEQTLVSNYIIGERDFQFHGEDVFMKTPEDDCTGLSVEDRLFLKLMDRSFTKDKDGMWTVPLPFRENQPDLPNNRPQALHRAQILHNSLQRDTEKKRQFVKFMEKVLNSGAAEVAPPPTSTGCWYLPLFGVRNPKKPDQIRGVFDSSAKYGGVSLNSVLMSGPDMINSLLGILLRFRKDEVAMAADIEQMFYRFRVDEDHRNYLRFFWYKENNPDDIMIEYRMTSHVFGNSPSPAIASYGLLKTVEHADRDVKNFVQHNFYVDDGLISLPNESDAISLMKRTQSTMKQEGQIRLHKITSNKQAVMDAFDVSDHGEQLKEIDSDDMIHRSLGLCWRLKDDTFVFTVPTEEKPFTRRGLLSTVNSLFDPLGFISPIIISGKILLRECTPEGVDWDEPLPVNNLQKWKEWQSSLHCLSDIAIPRMMSHTSVSSAQTAEVHIFSDASEKAIAASAYIKTVSDGQTSVRFIMGRSKLAPLNGHTIPRLELCGAVLATELAEIISVQLGIPLQTMRFYTDSRVVLGYIGNRTRRFYTYVSNRVDRILRISNANQWNFISSEKNPADSCTRCNTNVINIMRLPWITGPQWLCDVTEMKPTQFPLVEPDSDREVRPIDRPVICSQTDVTITTTGSDLITKKFDRFDRWSCLITGIACLKRVCRRFRACRDQKPMQLTRYDEIREAETFVLKQIQQEFFSKEINSLKSGKPLNKDTSISTLAPFLDENGLMCVGGRLNKAAGILPSKEINPIILPKNSHISVLLIRHFHEQVKHQGRLFTEGALRTAGYWILGGKRMISSFIHTCVTCRKLRRGLETQMMADLPEDRITPGPAFTSVGIDVFGPWEVCTRRTRGGAANSKRWGLMFTCLTSRAAHIEVIEEMSSSCFINALRRFLSLRGPVKIIRSDRGTNFIGAAEEMRVNTIKVEEGPVQQFLDKSYITWIFNVPHSSHMGGVWERVIGMTRKILDSMLLESSGKPLTHETLATFLCEVCAIINSRPIAPIPSDPNDPMILTPTMILTGKVDFLPVVSDSLSLQDVYRAQWKRVQILADIFWNQWRKQYLSILQSRRKWKSETRNVKVDDVVLLKDPAEHRNNWPTGIIDRVFPSDDGIVRKVVVRTIRAGKPTFYIRPIHDLVLLIESEQ